MAAGQRDLPTASTRGGKGRGQAGRRMEERRHRKERAQTHGLTRNHDFWLSRVGASVLGKLPPPPLGGGKEISAAAFRVSILPVTDHFSGDPRLSITSFGGDQAPTAIKGQVSHLQGTPQLHFPPPPDAINSQNECTPCPVQGSSYPWGGLRLDLTQTQFITSSLSPLAGKQGEMQDGLPPLPPPQVPPVGQELQQETENPPLKPRVEL